MLPYKTVLETVDPVRGIVKFTCPACSSKFKVEGDVVRAKVKCKSCRNVLIFENFHEFNKFNADKSRLNLDAVPKHNHLRYLQRKEINRGGMGAIYRVIDKDFKRTVAMKVMTSKSSDKNIIRFLQEARIMAQLDHPGIVPVHDIGQDAEGQFFFSMKLVDGESLEWHLDHSFELDDPYEKISLHEYLQIFMKICDAMAYAHSKGIIHRDLKPSNVMIGHFGEVLVLDWGLAKSMSDLSESKNSTKEDDRAIDDELMLRLEEYQQGTDMEGLTMDGFVVGTPSFMPPEQARGDIESIDKRSDIYSLGAILYSILTFDAPVDGEDAREILANVKKGRLVPPEKRRIDKNLPKELAAIAMKAMSPVKGKRYPSVESLKRDVELYLQGREVSAYKDNIFNTVSKLIRRNKAASLAVFSVVVALVIGLTIAMSGWRMTESALKKAEEQRHQALLAKSKAHQAKLQAEKEKNSADEERKKSIEAEEAARLANANALANLKLAEEEKNKALTAMRDAQRALERWKLEKSAREKDRIASAPAYLKNALKSVQARSFEQAKTQASQAVQFNPELADAHMLLSQLEIYNKNYAQGEVHLEKYLNLKPTDKYAMALLNLLNRKKEISPVKFGELLSELFIKQGAYVFANDLSQSFEEKLVIWRGMISRLWPGSGDLLQVQSGKVLFLNLINNKSPENLNYIKDIPIKKLNLSGSSIINLSVLKKFPIEELNLSRTSVVSLKPLTSLKQLKKLDLSHTRVAMIDSLAGLKLIELNLSHTRVGDISSLAKMPLKKLNLSKTAVANIDVLNGLPVKELDLSFLSIQNLDALRRSPVNVLNLSAVQQVETLIDLKYLPLRELYIAGTSVKSLHHIRRMKLEKLSVNDTTLSEELLSIKKMKTLKFIGTTTDKNILMPAETFFKSKNISKENLTPAKVHLLLGESNIHYNGTAEFELDNDFVTGAKIYCLDSHIENLMPLQVVPLKKLQLRRSGNIQDFTFLSSLSSLEELFIDDARHLQSLTLIKSRKLKHLRLHNAKKISNLDSVRNWPLESLAIKKSKSLRSLIALKNLKLKSIDFENCLSITSVSVLSKMPLESINFNYCSELNVKDLQEFVNAPVRNMYIKGFKDIRNCHIFSKFDLNNLDMKGNSGLESLDGLNESEMNWLDLSDCIHLKSVKALKGIKIGSLNLNYCDQIKDLNTLNGITVEKDLHVMFLPVDDLKIFLNHLKGFNFQEAPHILFLLGKINFDQLKNTIEGFPRYKYMKTEELEVYRAMHMELLGNESQAKKIYKKLSKSAARKGLIKHGATNRLRQLN